MVRKLTGGSGTLRSLAGAACVLLGAIAIAHWGTAAALVPSPSRPFDDRGNPAIRVGGSSYPRQAIGADDVAVVIADVPRRIVSRSWAIDEYLYAVVPPERIVGVSESAYHAGISNVHELVARYRPAVAIDPERVLRTNPDLVLTPAESRSDVSALLRSAGIAVFRTRTNLDTLASIEAHVRLVGYLTGEDVNAERVIAGFRRAVLRAARRKLPDAPGPRVLGIGGKYSYGAHTLFNDILRTIGARNVAADHGFTGYDRLSDEHIIRWNPEWIVAGADRGRVGDVRARLLANPAIAATTAGVRGQVIVFENRVFLPLSPFTAVFVEALAEALYGGGEA